MAGGNHSSSREWLQASPQFGDFLPSDRVQPAFRLYLDQRIFENPNASAGSSTHVDAAVGSESCHTNVREAAMHEQILDEKLETPRLHR